MAKKITALIVNQVDIKRLMKTDPVFKLIHKQYGQPPNWSRPAGFVSLCKIILEQQVSLASANAHFKKLSSYLPAFQPEYILRLTDTEMRECQVSRQKMKYLRELSNAILMKSLELDELPGCKVSTIREKLTSIKGIGKWTTDIYLMFCLQEKDVLPLGDIAVIKTIRELWEVTSTGDIETLAERWTPVRSLASYYLWHYYLCKRNRFNG